MILSFGFYKKSKFLCTLFISTTIFLSATCQTSIKQRINKITRSVPGTFGIAAIHIEKNKRFDHNSKMRFPMASTYKLPIAAYCMSLIEKKAINPKSKKLFTNYDLRRCSKIKNKQSFTIEELLKMNLEKSDNAASDMILKIVGGGKAVTNWLQKQGIKDISIDRQVIKMTADFSGITLIDEHHCTINQYVNLMRKVPRKNRLAATQKFYSDTQDTTTPSAMVNLLSRMYKGKLVGTTSKNFLFKSMAKCDWSFRRMKRFLPKGAIVYSKCGTMDGIVSDIGIIKLPQNKGHVALAVYTNKDTGNMLKREEAIGKVSKELFNYFKTL